MSLNAQTIISYHEKISKESINYMAYSNTISFTENYTAKGNQNFLAYIPLKKNLYGIRFTYIMKQDPS